MSILDAMPVGRECTLEDVCNRFKDQNGIAPNPDVVEETLLKARRCRTVEVSYFPQDKCSLPIYRRIK